MSLMERTYAVLVAIESYPSLGEGWTLQDAVAQARQFAGWLINERKVPPGNVQVFCSETNIKPFTDFGIPLKQCGDASCHAIESFFAGIGGHWPEGEVLFIYWIGHGFVSDERVRRLIYGDAIIKNKTNLDIDKLLLLLQSNVVGHFRHSIGFIDTCARFFQDIESTTTLPDCSLCQGATVSKGVTLNFCFAASSGEYAKNNTFGPHALELLKSLPADTWPPDTRMLHDRMRDAFDRLAADHLVEQQPAWYEYQDRVDDKIIFRVRPAPANIQLICQRAKLPVHQLRTLVDLAADCKALADPKARDHLHQSMEQQTTTTIYRPKEAKDDPQLDLMRIISGVAELGRIGAVAEKIMEMDTRSDAAFKFVRAAQSVASLQSFWPLLAPIKLPLRRSLALYKFAHRLDTESRKPGSIEEILEVLLELQDREPLVEFLYRVTQECQGNLDCKALLKWLEGNTDWAALLNQAKNQLAEEITSRKHLLVEIGKSGEAWQVIRSWLWSGSTGVPRELSKLDSQGGTGKDIEALVNETMVEEDQVYALYVEILAPGDSLHQEQGWLAWKNYDDLIDPERDYPIAMRWRDRMTAKPRDFRYRVSHWKKANEKIRDRLRFQPPCAYWLGTIQEPLEAGQGGELIGIPFAPGADDKLVERICNGGIPYACWLRRPAADLVAVKASVEKLVAGSPFDEIPMTRLELCNDGEEPLADILLLWDDPRRNPYDHKFSDVGQRG